MKIKYPHLKTLISVGGWGGSRRFSDVALTDASRATFAASCVEFVAANGLDGIDIDWEFPVAGGARGNARRPEDKANFTKLLATLRTPPSMPVASCRRPPLPPYDRRPPPARRTRTTWS